MIEKVVIGYQYRGQGRDETWTVDTDYLHHQIYLSAPRDDNDIEGIREFGIAIGRAVKDMRHDLAQPQQSGKE
jgi:hypothetical protein